MTSPDPLIYGIQHHWKCLEINENLWKPAQEYPVGFQCKGGAAAGRHPSVNFIIHRIEFHWFSWAFFYFHKHTQNPPQLILPWTTFKSNSDLHTQGRILYTHNSTLTRVHVHAEDVLFIVLLLCMLYCCTVVLFYCFDLMTMPMKKVKDGRGERDREILTIHPTSWQTTCHAKQTTCHAPI